ncbi:MAG: alpha/beta hydrolase [Dehalococcoidia bacterium]|nr:alpha/beta hydrolase [Dehalococcoidia bacterium]
MASMGTTTTAALILGILILALIAVNVHGRVAALGWVQTPYPPGTLVKADGTRLYMRVKGEGGPPIIIEPAMGRPGAEWWAIQDELARFTTVVTYDRAGYGWSRSGQYPRTSRQIATELRSLLQNANVSGPYLLLGHAQGGLYLQLFGRLFPGDVAGAVFLDPVSSDDQRFKTELSPALYDATHLDKMPLLQRLNTFGRLGLVRSMRSVFHSKLLSPFASLSDTTIEVMWQHYTLRKAQRAMLDECIQNDTPANSSEVRAAGTFPSVPIKIIFHSPQLMVHHMVTAYGLQRDDADDVEGLWEQLVRAYLKLSPHGEWIVANESGHNIHLDQRDLVIEEVEQMVRQIRNESAIETSPP